MPPARPKPRPRAAAIETLGDRIRDVVAARGLSAYAIARASGLDRTTVRRFLSGASDLTLSTASPLCAALGLRLAEVGRAARPRPAPAQARRAAAELLDVAAEPDPEGP